MSCAVWFFGDFSSFGRRSESFYSYVLRITERFSGTWILKTIIVVYNLTVLGNQRTLPEASPLSSLYRGGDLVPEKRFWWRDDEHRALKVIIRPAGLSGVPPRLRTKTRPSDAEALHCRRSRSQGSGAYFVLKVTWNSLAKDNEVSLGEK